MQKKSQPQRRNKRSRRPHLRPLSKLHTPPENPEQEETKANLAHPGVGDLA